MPAQGNWLGLLAGNSGRPAQRSRAVIYEPAEPLWRALQLTNRAARMSALKRASKKSLPKPDNRARMLEMRRFYAGHESVLGIIQYYESKKGNQTPKGK
jgi:hypothetical protein